MAEHLGIDINDSILDDPVNNKLFEFMICRAKKNTQIYRNIFRCYPEARKMNKEEKDDALLNRYKRMKNKILGNIVEFPLNFLKDEKLGKIIDYFSLVIPEKGFV